MKIKPILYIFGLLFVIAILGSGNDAKIEDNIDKDLVKNDVQQDIEIKNINNDDSINLSEMALDEFDVENTTKLTGEANDLSDKSLSQDEDIEKQNIVDENKTNENQGDDYYIVSRIVDGDTIEVSIDNNLEKVRLLGIDTPETVDPRKPVECFGVEASNKMKDLVGGKNVKLVSDETNSDRDNYGRLLRYVYLESGSFVNVEMIKQGYAYAYLDYPFIYKNDFKSYESDAKASKFGLWDEEACNDELVVLDDTDTLTERTGPVEESIKLQIIDIFYDGIESRLEPDEYVLIKNIGSTETSMNGYTLQDESGKTFIFSAYSLKVDEVVKVFTGCGTDSSSILYWCFTKTAIWNNSGDTAFLKDKSGNLVDSYNY